MENKICPLLSITGGLPTNCRAERCAWYVSGTEGRCAVQVLCTEKTNESFVYDPGDKSWSL